MQNQAQYSNYGVRQMVEFVERLAAGEGDGMMLRIAARSVLDTFKHNYDPASESNGHRCPECGTHTKYQGWANYPTWAVYTWMSNDQNSDAFMREAVEEGGSVTEAAAFFKDYFNDAENVDSDVAAILESSGLYSDLLQYSLDHVDWFEIADAFKPEEWSNADQYQPADTDN